MSDAIDRAMKAVDQDEHRITKEALTRTVLRRVRLERAIRDALVHLDHEHPGWAAQTLREVLGEK